MFDIYDHEDDSHCRIHGWFNDSNLGCPHCDEDLDEWSCEGDEDE